MLLFLDCETSGLLRRELPLEDPAQPWCVSIAAELCDGDGNALDFFSTRVRSEGRKVRDAASAIHGVTSRQADKAGVNEIVALGMLSGFAAQALYAVGHGVEFDRKVIEGVLLRKGKDPRLLTRPGLEWRDSMLAATPFCKIVPNPPRDDGGHKWASLDEASEILLGEPRREGPHTGWDDIQRTKRLYFWLLAHNAFEALAA